jgi:hypothetical protein
MGRGRHSYPKRWCRCTRCGWRGRRSTYWTRRPCPRCEGPVAPESELESVGQAAPNAANSAVERPESEEMQ